MNERKLFWLGFYGGIIRIFGILALLFAACMTLVALFEGKWLPLLFSFPPALVLYLFGWTLETVSELGAKINEIEARSRAQNIRSTPEETSGTQI